MGTIIRETEIEKEEDMKKSLHCKN